MPRRLLAVDPGTRLCGWAHVNEDGTVVNVGVVRSNADTLSQRAADMASDLFEVGRKCSVNESVVEMPRVYRTSRQKGDPNDIVELTFVAGGIAVILGALGSYAVTPTAHEWKGGVPKNIHHARLQAKCPSAIEPVGRLPKTFQNHVWDAVGLALWRLGKDR